MSAETVAVDLPEGVTPQMLRLGLIQNELEDLISTAPALSEDVSAVLFTMGPEVAGLDAPTDGRDAFWEGYTALVERYYSDPDYRASLPCSECGVAGGCEHFPAEKEAGHVG